MPCMKLGKKLLLGKKGWKGFTSSIQTKLHKLKCSKSIKKAKTRLNSTLSKILRRCRRRLSPRLRNKPTKPRIQTPAARRSHHSHKSFAPVFVDELFKEPVLAPVKHGEVPSTRNVVEKAAPSPPVGADGVKTLAAKVEKDASTTSVTAHGRKNPAAKAEKGAPSTSATANRSRSPVAKGEKDAPSTSATANRSRSPAAKAGKDAPSTSAIANRSRSPAAKAVMEAGSTSMAVNGARASPGESTTAEVTLWGVDARAEQFILQFKEEMRLQRQRSFREYQEMLARGVM